MHVVMGHGGYGTTSEDWWVLQPRRPGIYPLIMAKAGAGGEEGFTYAPWTPGVASLFEDLVNAGYIVMTPDAEDGIGSNDGSHTWGNDGSTTRFDAAVTWAKANLPVMQGKVGIFATSMGTLTGLNFWRRFPTKVAGMLTVQGAIKLSYHASANDNTFGKYQTEIYAAYGGAAAYAAAAPTHDPVQFVAANPALYQPFSMIHTADDQVTPLANVTDYQAAGGVLADLIVLPTGNHTSAAWDQIDHDEVIQIFRDMPIGA